MIITSKKEKIIKDLKEGLRNVDISKKYGVEPSYVSHIARELEIKDKLERLRKIEQIIKKDALEAYPEKMTEEEREFWRDL